MVIACDVTDFYIQFFQRKMLGTRYEPVGIPAFSDSRDPIFNSREPNRVPKTSLKKPCMHILLLA